MKVRIVIFSIFGVHLKISLRDGSLPEDVPGGSETLDDVAKRLFHDLIGNPIQDFFCEQLYTFSFKKRSLPETVVTYYFLYPEYKISLKVRPSFCPFYIKPHNNFDRVILKYALQRLRWKLEYTNIVYSLLPEEFTFSHLQSMYEAILGKNLDKRNFRKKFLSLHLLRSTGRKVKQGKARPAELFSFAKREVSSVKIF